MTKIISMPTKIINMPKALFMTKHPIQDTLFPVETSHRRFDRSNTVGDILRWLGDDREIISSRELIYNMIIGVELKRVE